MREPGNSKPLASSNGDLVVLACEMQEMFKLVIRSRLFKDFDEEKGNFCVGV